MNQITVYTTSTCPYCTMVKNLLNSQGLTFKEVNVGLDQAAANRLVRATGQLGVPQTEINGQWVLGYDPERIMQLVR